MTTVGHLQSRMLVAQRESPARQIHQVLHYEVYVDPYAYFLTIYGVREYQSTNSKVAASNNGAISEAKETVM